MTFMARTKSNLLTDIVLRQLVATGEPCAKSDGGGLTFTLSSAGTATWVLRFRHAKRRQEITLGRYPDVTLKAARIKAAAHRVAVQSGVNPATALRAAKVSEDWSVRKLIEDYRTVVLSGKAASTQASYGRNLKRVANGMGAISVHDVTARDVIAQIERTKTGYVERFTLWMVLLNIFKHAVGKQIITTTPCAGIILDSIIGKRPPVKKRLMLTEKELAVAMNAQMATRSNQLGLFIYLATGVRAEELATAKVEDIHLSEGRWHIPHNKLDRAFDVPLCPIVISWFEELLSLSDDSLVGQSAYLMPARRRTRIAKHGDTHLNKNTLNAAFKYWQMEHSPDIRKFTTHDLRSTAKSHLKALGVSNEISEMCLNHKVTGVVGIYDKHTYWKERRNT